MDSIVANNDNRDWTPRLNPQSRLKYLGIADALMEDVQAGAILPGDRLPTQRVVAQALGVDLTTVTKAFNEARRRGLITATIGRGTFVAAGPAAARTQEAGPDIQIDLSMNIPPQPEAAAFARRIPEAMAQVLSTRSASILAYQDSAGTRMDRMAGATWLSARFGDLDLQRIVVTAGSQNAVFAICACLAGRGEVIAAPALTYPGLQSVAARLGIRLQPLAMDDDGILPEAFEALCLAGKPAALYLVPTIDNPTTATLPLERRLKIAAIARLFSVPIIEDDPYGMLPDIPLPPIATLAPDLTWHIATLSKCVSPALRIAYVAAPDGAMANRLTAILRATNLMASPLMAAVLTRWIGDGTIETITTVIRDENIARQAIVATAITGQNYRSHRNGHHLWLHLPEGWKAVDFAYQAERSGLSVVPSTSFAIGGTGVEAVRISLGPPSDRVVLKRALDMLKATLTKAPQSSRIIV